MSPYLRNAWYVAAFSDEVGETPLARTLLDEELVIFRNREGQLAILPDRCSHRFAPLSQGKIIDGDLQCPYHGLRFNSRGECAHNPHAREPGAPLPPANLRAYPVVEKHGLIWFWPGDPAAANPDSIIEFAFLAAPDRFSVVKGYLHVRGNYQLISDNLLDLSHAVYIHPQFGFAGVDEKRSLASLETRLERRERSVFNFRLRHGLPTNAMNQKLFGMGDGPAITKTHMTWHPPALLDFDAGSWLEGTPEEDGVMIPQAHCITPETELTSHYFFVNGRNKRHGEKEVDEALLNLFDLAFRQQDEPMIEFVQKRMGDVSDITKLNPVYLTTDTAPIAARRILTRLIEEEQRS